MQKYKIIRFYRDTYHQRIVRRGLSLEEAQAHCQRDDTHGAIDKTGTRPWFDGYDDE